MTLVEFGYGKEVLSALVLSTCIIRPKVDVLQRLLLRVELLLVVHLVVEVDLVVEAALVVQAVLVVQDVLVIEAVLVLEVDLEIGKDLALKEPQNDFPEKFRFRADPRGFLGVFVIFPLFLHLYSTWQQPDRDSVLSIPCRC